MNHLPDLSGEGAILAKMGSCFRILEAKLTDWVMGPASGG
jgi:hypothetical protein